ncbi:MAG: bifunctional glutamate N-acetyltransferase/amino-acid acetyltransferase ArgJ [Gammaproteobacteria bacterium]|nr:bifunctional glutamate N-acetyltransferase/amino-acid acetyltransferase ArgJ [Gammaproteobacteria bacterium]MBT5863549.1 bifunctional glutamate N-acetyltransferase/amino-acid acetyltransferase ArgJ [Gammaproteobacteria bacterium]MBT6734632.1 bifunctional glutamate N-acetyltransferase/amino-acid acetyltransferase ArgJ [Gammaproteobacteria bacterium]
MSNKVLIDILKIGIKANKADAVCFKLPELSTTVAVSTQNNFAAAPVILSKKNLLKSSPKYILVNSGNANACTGKIGMENAIKCTELLSKKLKCKKEEILLSSTGIIGRQLPIDIISRSINSYKFNFKSNWKQAASTIMTTDKFSKHISRSFLLNKTKITINAICKGAGMIEPNMATMLSFISININLKKTLLIRLLKKSVDSSFNRISVDGDMSTNDTVMLISTGENKNLDFTRDSKTFTILQNELTKVCSDLSEMIIKDGEGATKVVKINIYKAHNIFQAKKTAYSLANSNLIKTAMYGADPNWGRIIARLGSISNINYSENKLILKINNKIIYEKGLQSKKCNLKELNKSMMKKNITIDLYMNAGSSSYTVLTSDLSHEYVHINSAYTT